MVAVVVFVELDVELVADVDNKTTGAFAVEVDEDEDDEMISEEFVKSELSLMFS